MENGKWEKSIAQYLKDHSQYLDGQQACAITGCRKRDDRRKALEAAGFTLDERNDMALTNALISPAWRTGGIMGGSCWGGEANQSVEGEEMPAWLEEFLETFAPETSFLKFRRVEQKCTRYTYTNDEYYGNSTDYAFQVLKVSDILAVLNA
jgi:hypothetical protein